MIEAGIDPDVAALVEKYFDGDIIQLAPEGRWKIKKHEKNPSAPLSPFYISTRMPDNGGKMTPELLTETGRLLWNKAQRMALRFSGVAGLPKAGDPLAEAFVAAAAVDGQYFPLVRLYKTERPDGRRIDGIKDDASLPQGCILLVIDDGITGGDTKDEGIGVLEADHRFIVNDILVVWDRQQGGADYLGRQGKRLYDLVNVPEILEVLELKGKIDMAGRIKILEYIRTH